MRAQLEPTGNPCGEITLSKLAPKRPKGHCKNPWTTWSNGQPSHAGCLSSEWPDHPTPTPGIRALEGKANSTAHNQSCEQETHHGLAAHNFQCEYRTWYCTQKEKPFTGIEVQSNLVYANQGKKRQEGPQKSGIMLKICWQENIFREKNTNPFTCFLVCL